MSFKERDVVVIIKTKIDMPNIFPINLVTKIIKCEDGLTVIGISNYHSFWAHITGGSLEVRKATDRESFLYHLNGEKPFILEDV